MPRPRLKELYSKGLDLIIPLQHHEEHIGSILVGHSVTGHDYSWREIDLLNLFAQNVATKLTNTQLNSQVQFDNLTGLYRREVVLDALQEAVEGFRQSSRTFSIAMIDLDDFKKLNDQHGHLFGDQALKLAADVAQQQLGRADRLGRFGGEEFLLLMPELDLVHASRLTEKIRLSIAETELPGSGTMQHILTVSVGVANIEELKGTDHTDQTIMRDLIDLADKKLYRAKVAGKNQVFSSIVRLGELPSLTSPDSQ